MLTLPQIVILWPLDFTGVDIATGPIQVAKLLYAIRGRGNDKFHANACRVSKKWQSVQSCGQTLCSISLKITIPPSGQTQICWTVNPKKSVLYYARANRPC